MKRLTAAMALLCLFSFSAEARPKQPRTATQGVSQCIYDNTARIVCPGPAGRIQSPRTANAAYAEDAQIVAHPAGCPRRLFCGCGVSVKVFGKPVRDLYLAANWIRKFPRTSPSSGMVAARRGHVFYIVSYLGEGQVLAYDPNSGGRKTRIHVRSLAGYVVVNPHLRVASHD